MQEPTPISPGLTNSTDGFEWASEFNRLYPDIDKKVLTSWFTGAIASGYYNGKKDAREAFDAMQQWRRF